MPYIKPEDRVTLDADPVVLQRRLDPVNPGELNYKITQLLVAYLGETPTYERYNAVVGVLECAKLELYRRMVVPYEEKKKEENGDVYPPERRIDAPRSLPTKTVRCRRGTR